MLSFKPSEKVHDEIDKVKLHLEDLIDSTKTQLKK